MLSTKDLSSMMHVDDLRRICKGISALEIIMMSEWNMRYYSYNPGWSMDEQMFEMRDGEEQHMLILFSPAGCVISGVDAALYDWENATPNIADLTQGLPEAFHEFMYEEPVKSLKSTFCIFTTDGMTWLNGGAGASMQEDGSEDMLSILNKNPQKYVDFCKWYYEAEVPLSVVENVYHGEPLTPEMIQALNSGRDDMDTIREELCEIGYPNTL